MVAGYDPSEEKPKSKGKVGGATGILWLKRNHFGKSFVLVQPFEENFVRGNRNRFKIEKLYVLKHLSWIFSKKKEMDK